MTLNLEIVNRFESNLLITAAHAHAFIDLGMANARTKAGLVKNPQKA